MAVDPDTLAEIVGLAAKSLEHSEQFHLDDELWSRILIEFACAHHRRPIERSHLLRSLTPLYLARVASFVVETRDLVSSEVDEKIENLCLCLEQMKPLLIERWEGETSLRATTEQTKQAGMKEALPDVTTTAPGEQSVPTTRTG
jgi:hypothetical protein